MQRTHNAGRGAIPYNVPNRLISKKPSSHFKPIGLWYALNEEWLDYLIETSRFGWVDIDAHYNIVLTNDANIYTLDNSTNLAKFEKTFGVFNPDWSVNEDETNICKMIQWNKVHAFGYDGIEIRNYHTLRQTHASRAYWLDGYDCSSGCVWNVKVIKEMHKIEFPDSYKHHWLEKK